MSTYKTSPDKQDSNNTRKYTPIAPQGYTYVTVDWLAERLNVSNGTIIRRIRDGYFPGVLKIGKLWRIPIKEELSNGSY